MYDVHVDFGDSAYHKYVVNYTIVVILTESRLSVILQQDCNSLTSQGTLEFSSMLSN